MLNDIWFCSYVHTYAHTHAHTGMCITRKTIVGYSLAPDTSLIMPFSGSTGTVVHVHGLTGSNKAICESRLGYLYPCAWCAWIVL